MFNLIVGVLLVAAFLLLILSKAQRSRLGLPAGQLVYEDMRSSVKPEESLYDEELNLVGRPDYLLRRGDELIPVEVKSGRSPQQPYKSHVFQLAAYCVLIASNFGQRPTHGLIRYPDRTFKLEFTSELEMSLLGLLDEMRAKLGNLDVPRSHQQPSRCRACVYTEICDQSL